ncbi:hypothetical protein HG530_013041 [Fusarium avenaceum]|nr:hypothetical protein HG530_013041 [Fusarium avenaceum]
MSTTLLDKANVHWDEALRLASPLLSQVTESNCVALYLFATITCLHTFALGPSPGELLIFNQNGPSHWLTLFRGLRSIEQACDFASVHNEELRPIFPFSDLELNKGPVKALDPAVREALEALVFFVDIHITKNDERRESLVEALALLPVIEKWRDNPDTNALNMVFPSLTSRNRRRGRRFENGDMTAREVIL